MKEKYLKKEKREGGSKRKKHVGSDRLIWTNNLELVIWHLPTGALKQEKLC